MADFFEKKKERHLFDLHAKLLDSEKEHAAYGSAGECYSVTIVVVVSVQ
jgi:hypothetical protein